MRLLVILLAVICWNCAPKAIPVDSPVKQTSALPVIKKASKAIDEINDSNKEIKNSIAEQILSVERQKYSIEQAIANSGDYVANILGSVRSENIKIEKSLMESAKMNEEQSRKIREIKDRISEANDKALLKENEANELRNQNKLISDNLRRASKELESEKIKAENAKVYKRWVLGIFGGLAAFLLIRFIMKTYFRL